MSIVVRNTRMPTSCLSCDFVKFFSDKQFYCGKMMREAKANVRPEWCPILCEIPDGHGPMIDRNEAVAYSERMVTNFNSKKELMKVERFVNVKYLYMLPAIVPEEGKDER